MSDLWGLFWGPNDVAKKICIKYGQEIGEAAIVRELQFCLDDITEEQIERIIENMKEDNYET